MGINILSLFDGISCGMIALERAGIKVNNYYASEIDKNAIAVSEKHYPDIIRLGDIENWKDWKIDWKSIDLIIGGSPCQGFSFAGKQLNFQDERSKLIFAFIDIFNYAKTKNPKVRFLLENVVMKKEYKDKITDLLKHIPLEINSRLVSAQDRKRLYWSNFYFNRPKDRRISASEVIGKECFAGAMRGRRIDENGKRADERKDIPIVQQIECRKDDKFNCVTTVTKDNVVVFSKEKFFPALESRDKWRYLTAEEMEMLQTIPKGYTDCVSDSARKRLIGNAWTVDVISHIFRFLPKEFRKESEGKDNE